VVKRLDRLTLVFLVLAIVWASAQLVLAFFVHVTERARLTGSGWVVPPTRTYMAAYGLSEVLLTVVTVGLVLLVAWALQRRRTRAEPGAGRLAWAAAASTCVLGLIGFAYLFGVGLCLLLACATVTGRTPAASAGVARSTLHAGASD
jgi:hypothetical protein